jgi:N-acetylglucosamine-6-phosphate deacetylase
MADQPLLITNANVITPTVILKQGWVFCADGHIAGVGSGLPPRERDIQTVDAGGRTVMPGFVDVHVHGGMGHDTMDASREALEAMARFYAAHGVTGFLATTWTDSHARITAALQAIRDHVGPMPDGAALLGAHLEGPYLNPARCGAQNLDEIRRATAAEAQPWLDLGVIRLVSVAPEYPENHWLISQCVSRGVTVSVAHTAATYDQMQEAIRLGLTHSTHTFNAMTPLNHREPGVVGAVLDAPTVRCEVIADNIHVHPAAMNILWKAKGKHGVVLVSDAVVAAGMPDGTYQIDARDILVKDGAVRLPDGTLAGSTLTLDRALKNFMAATGEPLTAVWQTVTLNPARAIGLGDRKGTIETGKDADLVLVDDAINVALTVVGGRIVYSAL